MGAIRRERDAGFERGEIVPDIVRPQLRRHQTSTMQVEGVDHHQIVRQAEIFTDSVRHGPSKWRSVVTCVDRCDRLTENVVVAVSEA